MSLPVHASIVEYFQTFEDPRLARTKKPKRRDSLVIAVCTLLTGGEGCQAMALFGKRKRAWLHPVLALPPGMPSHDTFGRVCARLNPQRLQECFLAWTRAVAQRPQGGRISLDGQTVKASVDRATASSPLHMLAAWCSENGGLVVGQIKAATQSHAMTAIPALLHWLAIKGCLVTIDATGCQSAIAGQIRPHGGDSLFAWKGNPQKAYPAVKQYLPQPSDPQLAWRTAEHFFDAFEDSHGRTVRRRGWTITDLGALPALTQWLDLQAIIVGATIRAAYPGAPITSDDRVYIASLIRSATAFVTMIRQHWDIEKKLHWSLDGTFNEDRSRIRQDDAPDNMAAVRHVALNLLRQEQTQHIRLRQTRLLCGLDAHYLLTVLSGAT